MRDLMYGEKALSDDAFKALLKFQKDEGWSDEQLVQYLTDPKNLEAGMSVPAWLPGRLSQLMAQSGGNAQAVIGSLESVKFTDAISAYGRAVLNLTGSEAKSIYNEIGNALMPVIDVLKASVDLPLSGIVPGYPVSPLQAISKAAKGSRPDQEMLINRYPGIAGLLGLAAEAIKMGHKVGGDLPEVQIAEARGWVKGEPPSNLSEQEKEEAFRKEFPLLTGLASYYSDNLGDWESIKRYIRRDPGGIMGDAAMVLAPLKGAKAGSMLAKLGGKNFAKVVQGVSTYVEPLDLAVAAGKGAAKAVVPAVRFLGRDLAFNKVIKPMILNGARVTEDLLDVILKSSDPTVKRILSGELSDTDVILAPFVRAALGTYEEAAAHWKLNEGKLAVFDAEGNTLNYYPTVEDTYNQAVRVLGEGHMKLIDKTEEMPLDLTAEDRILRHGTSTEKAELIKEQGFKNPSEVAYTDSRTGRGYSVEELAAVETQTGISPFDARPKPKPRLVRLQELHQQAAQTEFKMREAQQRTGLGEIGYLLEHGGDLLRRMTADLYTASKETPKYSKASGYADVPTDVRSHLSAAHEAVGEKLAKLDQNLNSRYGYEREVAGAIRGKADEAYVEKMTAGMDSSQVEAYKSQMRNMSSTALEMERRQPLYEQALEEVQAEVDDALAQYADAHESLTVYNDTQRSARDLAVALGQQDYHRARKEVALLQGIWDQGREAWETSVLKDDRQWIRVNQPFAVTDPVSDVEARVHEQYKDLVYNRNYPYSMIGPDTTYLTPDPVGVGWLNRVGDGSRRGYETSLPVHLRSDANIRKVKTWEDIKQIEEETGVPLVWEQSPEVDTRGTVGEFGTLEVFTDQVVPGDPLQRSRGVIKALQAKGIDGLHVVKGADERVRGLFGGDGQVAVFDSQHLKVLPEFQQSISNITLKSPDSAVQKKLGPEAIGRVEQILSTIQLQRLQAYHNGLRLGMVTPEGKVLPHASFHEVQTMRQALDMLGKALSNDEWRVLYGATRGAAANGLKQQTAKFLNLKPGQKNPYTEMNAHFASLQESLRSANELVDMAEPRKVQREMAIVGQDPLNQKQVAAKMKLLDGLTKPFDISQPGDYGVKNLKQLNKYLPVDSDPELATRLDQPQRPLIGWDRPRDIGFGDVTMGEVMEGRPPLAESYSALSAEEKIRGVTDLPGTAAAYTLKRRGVRGAEPLASTVYGARTLGQNPQALPWLVVGSRKGLEVGLRTTLGLKGARSVVQDLAEQRLGPFRYLEPAKTYARKTMATQAGRLQERSREGISSSTAALDVLQQRSAQENKQ